MSQDKQQDKQKEKNYITPAGHQKLVDELTHLSQKERPEVTKVVTWAASNGDRSENADYQYGKKRLREIDRRVRFLNKRIDCAIIVDLKNISCEKVQFGSLIEIENEEGMKKKLQIVGVDEIDTQQGKISWRSPLGSALLGKSLGDEAVVKTPQGETLWTIIHLSTPKS